jgi:hypothetical protein
MCACTDFTANNTLDTDSLDSKMGPKKLAGGSVGVNGSYSSSAPTNIGGALLVAGTMTTQNTHDVVHDLSCNGDAKIGAPAVAEKDAYVGGNVIGPPKDLTVQGKLHTPIDANAAQVNALGGVVAGAVSVAPPCDCSGPVDIPAIVAAFKGTNDNATNGVAADALTDKPNYPKDLTLPCGRYYLNGINVNRQGFCGEKKIVSNKRSVSETKKKYVAAQQGWKCGDCGNQLTAWFEVDHKIRLEYGGSNHIDNLVALCRDCHGEKTAIENL